MKHKPKITAILLIMFFVTQLIGLYVVNYYSPTQTIDGEQLNVSSADLPFGLEPPQIEKETEYWSSLFPSIIFAFVLAVSIFFLLTKFKAELILRIWFVIVIIIALTISLMSLIPPFQYTFMTALIIAGTLAFFKVFKRYILVHNLTELLIYPGIAAVFVALLVSPTNPNTGIYAISALLILISIYDIWAVWHSGIMQKMAKYQMDKVKVFAGFFLPYVSKSQKAKIKKMKKSRSKKDKGKKIRVNVAILGGGDVVFPIIAAGVILMKFGFKTINLFGLSFKLPMASLIVALGATVGLAYLFMSSEKKKFYPAMPFISTGIFAGIGLSYLLSWLGWL